MTSSKLDTATQLIQDIDAEVKDVSAAIDSEVTAFAPIADELAALKTTVSPENEAKLDAIIEKLQATKENLSGYSDRIKAIIPDPVVPPTVDEPVDEVAAE